MGGRSARSWQRTRCATVYHDDRGRPSHGRGGGGPQRGAPCALPCSAGPSPSPTLPEDTHYAALGLAPGATPAEVRRAYLRRVAAAHPDKGGDRAAFDRVQAAHAVLSNPTERLIYDEQLQRRLAHSGGWNEAAAGSSGGDSGGRICRSGHGVTVVVHGQAQGSPRAQQPCKARHASCAGQRAGCASEELQAVTAEVQRLQGSGGGKDNAAAADLAAAHLRRAELHRAAGQVHHALFDAEEALRLQPGSEQAAALVADLEAAAAAEEQANEANGGVHGSDGSDGDPF